MQAGSGGDGQFLVYQLTEGVPAAWLDRCAVGRLPRVAGGATLYGSGDGWQHSVFQTALSHIPLWEDGEDGDFDFVITPVGDNSGALARMTLKAPITFRIDLSSVDVGQAFTLESFVEAETYNRIAGPPSEFGSSVSAFLRDPQSINGTTVTFSGLEPIEVPDLTPPADVPVGRPVRIRSCSGPRRRGAAVQRRQLHAQ